MSHKGDWHRVGDLKAYQDNYEQIFKRKTDKPEEIQVCPQQGSRPNQQGEDCQNGHPSTRNVSTDSQTGV